LHSATVLEIVNGGRQDLKISVAADPHWQIIFVKGGQRHEALNVFEQARDFWTQYIYPNKIASGGFESPGQ